MITQIRSNLVGFRTGSFKSGMNIVLADTAESSDEKESTNGLGKTTLIRIIHFCLGGDIRRDKVLSHPELDGVCFGMTFIWNDCPIMVDRATNNNTVLVSEAFLDGLSVKVLERKDGRIRVTLADWKRVLSMRFVPDAEISSGEFSPSFREMLLYLVRLGKAAFNNPTTSFKQQPAPSERLVTSFLLGLNWSKQRELQEREQERKHVISAIKALQHAQASTNEQSIGDLEADRVALEKQIDRNRKKVTHFNVRDDYRDIEEQLNEVSRELHNQINENHNDRKLLEYCQLSANDDPEIPTEDPAIILKEAGVIFKEETLRSLDEISNFHRQVYRNRGEFLQSEVDRLESEIASRNARIDELSGRKQNLLGILQSSGALETLMELRKDLSELESRAEALKVRIDERKRFDCRKDEIIEKIISIKKLLKRDLYDRREIVDEVVDLFDEYTQKLYGIPGKLGVDVGDRNSGYRFSFIIDREGSDGVDQMVVFCFDLMVATLRARRGQPFITLVHDSSIFADVDPRQYGLALQLAAAVSESEGFQYICCLNTGTLPRSYLDGFDIDGYVRLRLSDDSDEGRLLGRRLPPREHT